ncbi:hypothetical protein BSKO_00990 [Bryopsis sp. KO-2023]|nr:hypothetical protein BSKO_00990 [Bryopsis sp. KO-2023]
MTVTSCPFRSLCGVHHHHNSTQARCQFPQRFGHSRGRLHIREQRVAVVNHFEKALRLDLSCQCATKQETTASTLDSFLTWAKDNGVEGGKIGIFEGQDGERGVASLAPIAKDELVVRLPLRLAIVDVTDDLDDGVEFYEGAPWSVRLACKLLRLKSEGFQCPWYPYLQSLPDLVPGILSTFQWEDMQAIEYQELKDKVNFDIWLVMDSWQRLSADAHGGASRDEYDWAMSIVHSRCFGVVGKKGGVGAHMLLPYVDMMNHGGDCTDGLLSGNAEAMDNVRWDVEASPDSPSTATDLCVYACRDIQKGEEILLSYGERNNDDFLLHYGFVPPRNPRDDVILFPGLEEAIEWYCQAFPMEGDQSEIDALKESALKAGEAEDVTPKNPMLSTKSAEALKEEAKKISLMAGGFVDGRLLAAFGKLGEKTEVSPRSGVAERCWEMLDASRPLLQDLEDLVADGEDFEGYLQFYTSAIERYGEALGRVPGNESIQDAMQPLSTPRRNVFMFRAYKKVILWDVLLGLGKK